VPGYKNSPVWASQNFLTSSVTIKRIISLSSIRKTDHVVEIGAGKGHITEKLIKRSGKVTAIEIDRALYRKLSEKFRDVSCLCLVCRDFMKWNLPGTPYKVFANIPFNRTTDIIRKLTYSINPPEEAWLVIEKGAAKRFMGKPTETILSLNIKALFDCDIKYYFRRVDFHPAPSVDAVLFHLKKKAVPDISPQDRNAFNRFVARCLSRPSGISTVLTKKQVSRALKMAGLPGDIACPGEMRYIQWLCLFRCYMKYGKRIR
jgi:23S rRNA (adenine-N6)-dimethyltransferase